MDKKLSWRSPQGSRQVQKNKLIVDRLFEHRLSLDHTVNGDQAFELLTHAMQRHQVRAVTLGFSRIRVRFHKETGNAHSHG